MAANSTLQTTFAHALEACLAQASLPFNSPIAVAVSGGADSMALALLANHWAHANGCAIFTYTVDHQLRPESAHEAVQVGAWMAQHGIPHRTLLWEHAAITGNLHDAARNARYELLAAAAKADGCQALLVAHHADDQAETLLANLVRGSGVDGLCAMPAARQLHTGCWLLRPLLGVSKADLVTYCRAQQQTWIEDPSNHAERFTRTLLRRLLADFEPQGLSAARLAEVASNMQRAHNALEGTLEGLCVQHEQRDKARTGFPAAIFATLPEELQLRLLVRWQQHHQPHADRPRMENLQRLRSTLLQPSPRRSTLGDCVWGVKRGHIYCQPEA